MRGNFLRRPRTIHAAAALAGALGSLAAIAALASCIIADPPPDLPKPPRHHPIIVKGSVAPPYAQVLSTLDVNFVAPVELIDPDTSFSWRVFLDYDPTQATQLVQSDDVAPTPATVDGGVYMIQFDLRQAVPDPSTCHVIELVVALGFNSRSLHTPDSNGADSIVWFYSPTGEPGGCPRYDAGGADGAFPDVEADRIFVPDVGGQ